LAAARAGRGGALFVVGEAGLGKTSVLEAVRRQAQAEAGMGVGFARGEQIESGLAFGVAREALGELAQLDREPVADSSAPYYRVLRALQERRGGPLLVAVDDLHWSDPVAPVMWVGHALAAYLAVDRVKDALRVTELLEECIAAVPCLPCRGPKIHAHTARAALAARAGDDAGAERHYLAALALHAEIDLPLVRVETLLADGAFLRRHGRSRDARAPLGEARQLAETLEAGWLADTARRELQLAGGRRRSADRDQLTDAEQHVAELAAAGLTNAEIARRLYLSPSTIETHLRHIYGKLESGSVNVYVQPAAKSTVPPPLAIESTSFWS
jgi:DNA-binding CsgD family transcriptional regulator